MIGHAQDHHHPTRLAHPTAPAGLASRSHHSNLQPAQPHDPTTGISSPVESIRWSLVPMAPWTVQSVVAGSSTVTVASEDGLMGVSSASH